MILGQEDPLEDETAAHSCSCLEYPTGRGAMVGYSLWGCKESDMTEQLALALSLASS